jgi:hypothetical protein
MTSYQAAEKLRYDAQQRGDYASERKYETLWNQAWTTETGKSAEYHYQAVKSGLPQAPNPYERTADMLTYAAKGNPQKSSEAFSPVDYSQLNLPGGKGNQAYVWQPDSERKYDLRGAMDVVAKAQRSGGMGEYGNLGKPTSSTYGILSLEDQQAVGRYVNENPAHNMLTDDNAMSKFTPEVRNMDRGKYVSSMGTITPSTGSPLTESDAKRPFQSFGATEISEVTRPSDQTLFVMNAPGMASPGRGAAIGSGLIALSDFFFPGASQIKTTTGRGYEVERASIPQSGEPMATWKYIDPDTNKPIDKMTVNVGKPYEKDGQIYQDYRVSDLSKVTVVPTKTEVIPVQSGFERGETNFANQVTKKYTPDLKLPRTGTTADYNIAIVEGMYAGVREKPLTATINAGVGLGLTAATVGIINPAVSGAAAGAVATGSRLAIPAAIAEFGVTKAVPALMMTGYTYEFTSTATKGFTDLSPEAAGRAGKRFGYETGPMIVGGLAFVPLETSLVPGALNRASTSYNTLKAKGWENLKSDLTWKIESTARNVKSGAIDFAEYGFAKPKTMGQIRDTGAGYIRESVIRSNAEKPAWGTKSRGNPELAVNRAKTEFYINQGKSTPSSRPALSQMKTPFEQALRTEIEPPSLSQIKDRYAYTSRNDLARHHDPIGSWGTAPRGNPVLSENRGILQDVSGKLKTIPSSRDSPLKRVDDAGFGGMQRVYGNAEVQYTMKEPMLVRPAEPLKANALGGAHKTSSAVKAFEAREALKAESGGKSAGESRYYWGQEIGSGTETLGGKFIRVKQIGQSKSAGKAKFERVFEKAAAENYRKSGLVGIEETPIYKLGKGKGGGIGGAGGSGGTRPYTEKLRSAKVGEISGGSGSEGMRIGSLSRFEAPSTMADELGISSRSRIRQRVFEDEYLNSQTHTRLPPGVRAPSGVSQDNFLRQDTGIRTATSSRAAETGIGKNVRRDRISSMFRRSDVESVMNGQRSAQGQSLTLAPRLMTGTGVRQGQHTIQISSQISDQLSRQIQTQKKEQAQVPLVLSKNLLGQQELPVQTTVTRPQDQVIISRGTRIINPPVTPTIFTERPPGTTTRQRPDYRETSYPSSPRNPTIPGLIGFPSLGSGLGTGYGKKRRGKKFTEYFNIGIGDITGSILGGRGGGGFGSLGERETGKKPRTKKVYGNWKGSFTPGRGKTVRVRPLPKRLY